MKKIEITACVDDVMAHVDEYNAAVRTYGRVVRRHSDTIETLDDEIRTSLDDVVESRERLEHELDTFQSKFSNCAYSWGELLGDPRKIEYRAAIPLLQSLLGGEHTPVCVLSEMPDSPEYPTPDEVSISRQDAKALSGLLVELLEDAEEDKRLEALGAQHNQIEQQIAGLSARSIELSSLILALTAERETLKEVMSEAHELLEGIQKARTCSS